MAHIWDKTTAVPLSLAKDLIAQQFNLEIVTIELFGEGFDNTAYLVNKQFVFRFPHRDCARVAMENEITLLPYIAQHLLCAIPVPLFIGAPTAEYPYPFAGYKIVPGTLLSEFQNPLVDASDFAKMMGLWLRQLHSIPVVQSLGLKGEHEWRLDVGNRIQRAFGSLERYRDLYIQAGYTIKQITDALNVLQSEDSSGVKRSYVHGDLYAKHIVVDQSGLPSGLIDWGDCHVGHPALDISVAFMIFTERARDSFFQAYGSVDQSTMQIAQFRALWHSVLALPYFMQMNDAQTVVWTKAALDNALKKV